MQTRNWLILALFCACLFGCGGSESIVAEGQPAAGQGNLPGIGELDALRGSSAVLLQNFSILASQEADIDAGAVTLTPPAGSIGWVLLDLGSLSKGSSISSLSLPDAPDWAALEPPGSAWLAIADYASARWKFVEVAAGDIQNIDLSGLTGVDFTSPAGHAYIAIITEHPALPLGQGQAVGHDGLLARTEVLTAELPNGLSGRFNATSISSEGMVDIVLMDEDEEGGVLLRGELNGNSPIDWETTDLSGIGSALNSASHYQCQHRSDDRLTIMAARTESPPSLRFIRETGAGTETFDNETAVDSELLPEDFSDPQFDYDLALADGEDPHIVYVGLDDTLVYAFRFVGGWFVTSGGENDVRFPSIACAHIEQGDDLYIAWQDTSGVNSRLVVQTHELRGLEDSWSALETITPSAWRDAGQFCGIMDNADGSLAICHASSPAALADLDLNFAYDADGNINNGWLNQSPDMGLADFDDTESSSREVGFACRMARLSGSQPVIAYYDEDGALWLAAAQSPGGGSGDDSGWLRLLVDGEPGFDPGQSLGIAVHPPLEAGGPQHIVISYEKRSSTDNSTPFYSVVEWLSN